MEKSRFVDVKPYLHCDYEYKICRENSEVDLKSCLVNPNPEIPV